MVNFFNKPIDEMTPEELRDHIAKLRSIFSSPARADISENDENFIECHACEETLRIPNVPRYTRLRCPVCEELFLNDNIPCEDIETKEHSNSTYIAPTQSYNQQNHGHGSNETKIQSTEQRGQQFLILALLYFIVGMMFGSSSSPTFQGAAALSISFICVASLLLLPCLGFIKKNKTPISRAFLFAWIASVIVFFIRG